MALKYSYGDGTSERGFIATCPVPFKDSIVSGGERVSRVASFWFCIIVRNVLRRSSARPHPARSLSSGFRRGRKGLPNNYASSRTASVNCSGGRRACKRKFGGNHPSICLRVIWPLARHQPPGPIQDIASMALRRNDFGNFT